jgi:lactose/L-arabinose transport system permease protein
MSTAVTTRSPRAARPPRRKPGHGKRNNPVAYLLIAPFIIVFLVFQAFALAASLGLSFTDWHGSSGGSWVGLGNYTALFQDPAFILALWHTALLWVLTVPILSFGGLALAYLLMSSLVRWARTLRTLLFVPTMPSLVVAGTIFLLLLDPSIGLPAKVFTALGLEPINIHTDPGVAIPVLAVIVIWRWLGYNMIIHLAALQNLPHEVIESATLDRATRWQIFWKIVVPMSKPMLLFTTVISTIGIAGLFDEPYVLFGSSGGPSQGGLTLGVFMYREGFQYFNLGYASAITYVIAIIVFIFALIQMRVSSDD